MKRYLFILLLGMSFGAQAVHPIKMQIAQNIKRMKKKKSKKPSKTHPEKQVAVNLAIRLMPAQ